MKKEAVVTRGIIKVTTINIPAVMGQVVLTVVLVMKKRKSIIKNFTGHLPLNTILM